MQMKRPTVLNRGQRSGFVRQGSRVLRARTVTGLIICAGASAVVSPAAAQDADRRVGPVSAVGPAAPAAGGMGISTVLDEVVVLRAIVGKEPASNSNDCVQSSSHSDFTQYQNPTGQSVIVQAGFAAGEYTAQTYTLPASAFPIKINTIETIFATSNSSVMTTTEWTVTVWEGTPQTGTVVASYSSDGDVLPHLVLPIGNAAGVIQFGIDPSNPEQIVIFNNGTNSFSVGFRIDKHNNPSSNPCLQGAPTCCNAFPVTDNSGLASASGNWLFGLNCGPLGCPPNGGWATFAQLGAFCSPSGDWILRANWQPLSCTPGIGACCLPNGQCNITSPSVCTGQGGVYRGDGVDCANANCPPPTGACCFANGNCLKLTQGDCAAAAGTWLGGGTACLNGQCPTGACCMPSGGCTGGLTSITCAAQGGNFQGAGTQCSGINCPQPSGACCVQGGGCLSLTAVDCGQIPNSSWAGAFTDCGDPPHPVCSPCYANCDGSTSAPILNVEDFTCFINAFASAQGLPYEQQVVHYANCDESTAVPVLNVEDFTCFINAFAAGCS